jgi:O-antigen/teichoic acid export membrane protein
MVQPESTTEVSEAQSKILRNTTYLTGAFVLQKIISFLYYTVVVSHIGVTKTGEYDPLKSLIPITLILIDFSLSAVVIREVARRPGSTKSIVSNVLGIKLIFALIVLTLFGIATNFGNFSQEVQSSLYLIALIVAFDTFTLTFFAVLRGFQNMKYEAVGMIINQLITVSLGYCALRLDFGIRGVFFTTLVGSFVNFGWAIYSLRKFAKIWPKFIWDAKIIVPLLKMAVPFAIAAILVKVYTYTDRYLLLLLKGREAVAFYAVAHKLTFALEFLPSAFAAGLYPAMSNYFISSHDNLQKTFERAMVYMMVIAVPLSVMIFVLARGIVGLAFNPHFGNSAAPLEILILSLPVIFMNFPVGTLLNAANRTRLNTISMGVTVLVNISLNVFLIQSFSYLGSAFATFISGITLFALGMYWTRRVISIPWRSLISRFFRVYAAAILGGLIIYPLRNSFSIQIMGRDAEVVIFGVLFFIIYLVGLLIFKGMRREEFIALKRTFLRRSSA